MESFNYLLPFPQPVPRKDPNLIRASTRIAGATARAEANPKQRQKHQQDGEFPNATKSTIHEIRSPYLFRSILADFFAFHFKCQFKSIQSLACYLTRKTVLLTFAIYLNLSLCRRLLEELRFFLKVPSCFWF